MFENLFFLRFVPYRSVHFSVSCQHHSVRFLIFFLFFKERSVVCNILTIPNWSRCCSSASATRLQFWWDMMRHDSNITRKYWRKWGERAPYCPTKTNLRWKWIHHISFCARNDNFCTQHAASDAIKFKNGPFKWCRTPAFKSTCDKGMAVVTPSIH